MKKFLMAVFVCLLSLNLSISDAEAARLGGGRSAGMQRQLVTPRPAAPAQQAVPTPSRPAPAGRPLRNVCKPCGCCCHGSTVGHPPWSRVCWGWAFILP